MTLLPVLLLSAVLQAPVEVDVSQLSGEQQQGQLVALTPQTLTISMAGNEKSFPVAEITQLEFPAASPAKGVADKSMQVTLVDGSVFNCTDLRTAEGAVAIESAHLGSFSVPLAMVASIRFGEIDPAVTQAWRELQDRDLDNDLLIIRKNDVLDHLDGVVGGIDEKTIRFLLDGDTIPVGRQRVFGIVYLRRNTDQAKPVCRIDLADKEVVQAREVSWDGTNLRAQLLSGTEISIPSDRLRTLDFSLGKIKYLAQMEPREIKHTPLLVDLTRTFSRDSNLDGGPLVLGNKSYSRGLCIHSKTYVKFRIGSEYRRFQAIMGIDRPVSELGNVHVTISGDGRTLLESDVDGSDAPRAIDLDVTDVRDLEILVDYGAYWDISDHLDLVEARVIK